MVRCGERHRRGAPLAQRLTAAKPQMIVGVTVLVHDTRPVPERRAPAASVVVRTVRVWATLPEAMDATDVLPEALAEKVAFVSSQSP